MKVTATFGELKQIFSLQSVCQLCHVDYCKMYMVDDSEMFYLTDDDFIKTGLLLYVVQKSRPESPRLGPALGEAHERFWLHPSRRRGA